MPDDTHTFANARADVNQQTVKPGIRTTEFWITIAMIVVSTALAIAQVIPGDHAVIAAGILTILYKAMRTFVKVRASEDWANVAMAVIDDQAGVTPAGAAGLQDATTRGGSRLNPRNEAFDRAQGLAVMLALGLALCGCASTSYVDGNRKFKTQADAARIVIGKDGSLVMEGVNHSVPTQAGAIVIDRTGTALTKGVTAAGTAFVTGGVVR